MQNSYDEKKKYRWRFILLVSVLMLLLFGLIVRIFYLGIIKRDFLMGQSKVRSVREVSIPAHRGMITDRNGEPLAISIPVTSLWINPQSFTATNKQIAQIAAALDIPANSIKAKIEPDTDREFVYLKRGLAPEVAAKVLNMHLPGVFSQTEYRRFYPEVEATSQVVGFTDIDDHGQEGLELAFDSWLYGTPGKMRVIKDCLGNVVANLEVISEPQEGHDLTLSIDRRIQYLAYRELKETIAKYDADSGSVIVLAVKTGEVLADVNFPAFNPNNRAGVSVANFRNRAVTDLFEPGSTMKAFSIAAAIDSGKFTARSQIDTNPGYIDLADHRFYDNEHRNNGVLSLVGVLQKSSDVGVIKIMLQLAPSKLIHLLRSVGFGKVTDSGFPGEAAGVLPSSLNGKLLALANVAFGYGMSATVLQLAQAYAVLASGGFLRPITFLKVDKVVNGQSVLSKRTSTEMLKMLETVLDIGGTGTRANIPGYHVAGKTGTAYIAKAGGYYEDRYYADFAGIAPVSDPQLVVVVVIKNPHGQYHGGMVAAPAFANITEGTLRILGILPDDMEDT
jgi:cell division protein FtsI (penicillin-binding protein 3)